MFDGKQFGQEIVGIVKSHVEKTVAPLLAKIEALEKQIAAIPPTAVNNAAADAELLRQMIADAIGSIPPAEKGKDADPVEVAAQIAVEVERAMAALPAPQDGKSVTVDELLPVIEERVAKAVAELPVAKDGIDAVDVMIDREGSLIFTMSDGRMKNVGQVVGRDGLDVDMAAVSKSIAEQVATIPRPRDGADAVGFDDMDLVETDQGVFLRFTRGDVVKDFRLPIVTDRGVFKEGTEYRKGDGVTWGGSFWIAQGETIEKPDSGKGWRLAVKKGRDGKDGQMKPVRETTPVKVG